MSTTLNHDPHPMSGLPRRRPNNVHHSGRGQGDHRHDRMELKQLKRLPSPMRPATSFCCDTRHTTKHYRYSGVRMALDGQC